ncbi:MAG: hypothetical protein R3301_01040 [Saprospiraceae bacterium]|nr:hypothetical protein [Saprospiraceae bacterium]
MRDPTLLSRFISWLQQRPLINAALVVVYFLVVVLPHEAVGSLIHRLLFRGSVADYNLTFMLIFAAVVGIAMAPVVRCAWIRRPPARLLAGTLLVVGLMIVAYRTIMVLSTEAIHYVQYAVMAILLYPLLRHHLETVVAATLLGVLDELYQYLWLKPADPGYYDFNDVVLNVLGAMFGLCIVGICDGTTRARGTRPVWRSPFWLTVGSSMVILGILWACRVWSVFPPEASTSPPVVLMPQVPDAFWSVFYDKAFHIMTPMEGLVAVICLIWLSAWMLPVIGQRVAR